MANNKKYEITKKDNNNIVVLEPLDKEQIKTQIYELRGLKVMLDSDIAKYFDVETGALNRAMKRNIKRFPERFCFQISKSELDNLKCQIGISSQFDSYGGRRTLPYVYTEQGVSMLTSCLHTDRAIEASIFIMEAFVELTHFIRENQQLLPHQELLRLSHGQAVLEEEVKEIKDTMVTKNDLADIIKLFDSGLTNEEVLILNGEPLKADLAYQRIFKKAKSKIFIIDDYISIKTLEHLRKSKAKITIFTDNKGKHLTHQELIDFNTEYPNLSLTFIKTNNTVHDRFIVIDYKTKNEEVWHLGASIKDSGNKITMINKVGDSKLLRPMIESLLQNPLKQI